MTWWRIHTYLWWSFDEFHHTIEWFIPSQETSIFLIGSAFLINFSIFWTSIPFPGAWLDSPSHKQSIFSINISIWESYSLSILWHFSPGLRVFPLWIRHQLSFLTWSLETLESSMNWRSNWSSKCSHHVMHVESLHWLNHSPFFCDRVLKTREIK